MKLFIVYYTVVYFIASNPSHPVCVFGDAARNKLKDWKTMSYA